MRKETILCLFLSVLLLLTGCTQTTPEPSLYDRGLEVISLMDDAIHSDAYLEMLSASDELRQLLHEAAAGDYAVPDAVYSITFAASAFSELVEIPALPETLLDVVQHRMISAVISQVNAAGGVNTLAASTMCTVGKTFVSSQFSEDIIYLYTFRQGCPVAVTFTGGEDQTVTATANIILYDGFDSTDPQSIQDFFGSDAMTVTDITPKN